MLSVLGMQYVWWPLSPLGFALSGSWGMSMYLWLRPFFFGLILGEFSQTMLWATISGIWRTPAPFFPWP
ncbi:MAG: DUF6784 domain-containing protein [Armatimonadota bacterium]|nr:DUF6784 domain-containing protein [Armatimonadota bacterium]